MYTCADMLSFFLSVILLSSSYAATPCCMGRQWEATYSQVDGSIFIVGGKPVSTLLQNDVTMHIDFYSKKIAMEIDQTWLNGTTVHMDILVDYAADRQYMKMNGNCYQTQVTAKTSFLESCIPADALHIMSTYIGYGANEIPFTVWQFLEPKTGAVIRLSVTDNGCIPLFDSMFGIVDTAQSDYITIVTNYTPGIRKPSVFDIPKTCTVVGSNDLPEYLRENARRSTEMARNIVSKF